MLIHNKNEKTTEPAANDYSDCYIHHELNLTYHLSGHILPIGGLSMDIGGRDLTNYFTKLLQSHHNLSTERQLSCQIKVSTSKVQSIKLT